MTPSTAFAAVWPEVVFWELAVTDAEAATLAGSATVVASVPAAGATAVGATV